MRLIPLKIAITLLNVVFLPWCANASEYFVTLRDSYGNVGNNKVAKVSVVGSTLTVLDDSFFDAANLAGPTGIVRGPNGNFFVANTFSNSIQEYKSDGSYVGVFADATDGLFGPSAIKFQEGSFYVANLGDPAAQPSPNWGNTVTKIDANTGVATTFLSGLGGPSGLAFDSVGNLHVSEGSPDTSEFPNLKYNIRKFDSTGTELGGPYTDASLNFPSGLAAVPNTDNILVSSTVGQAVVLFDGTNFSVSADVSSLGNPYPGPMFFLDDSTFLVGGTGIADVFQFSIDANGISTYEGKLADFLDFSLDPSFGVAIGDFAAVPEPSGVLLGLISAATMGYFGHRRRRN